MNLTAIRNRIFPRKDLDSILSPIRRIRENLTAHVGHHSNRVTKKAHKITRITQEVNDHQDTIREARRVNAALSVFLGE